MPVGKEPLPRFPRLSARANLLPRARRRKCVFPNVAHATACEYCLARGLRCVQVPPEGGYYAQRQARLLEVAAATVSPEASFAAVEANAAARPELPPLALRLELVDLYFQYIHDQFHSLYHRPTFIDQVANETVPDVVLLAIFALSSR